jgi:hypothetical protein
MKTNDKQENDKETRSVSVRDHAKVERTTRAKSFMSDVVMCGTKNLI